MKKWYLSKTMVIGGLQLLAGLSVSVAEWLQAGDFSPVAIALLINGLLMVGLRMVTKEPVSL